jgi:hypothetical protein
MADAARPVLAPSPGGQTAVAWMDVVTAVPAVYVAVVDDNLTLDSTIGTLRLGMPTASASFPWLAGDGSTLGAIWSDQRTGVLDIHFVALDAMLTPSHESVLRDATGDAQLGRLIQITSGYLAAWEDTRSNNTNEIYSAITDANGARQVEQLVEEPNTGDANWPNMAWNGTAAGIVYYQFRGGAPQIFISFVDATGARVGGGSDLRVSMSTGSARFPDVKWTGSEFGVAWVDSRDTVRQIYFAQVTCQ